jgi:hypothetical protein
VLATLADIDDASEDLRYLLQLEPGKFSCGTDRVVMKPWVSIAFAGRRPAGRQRPCDRMATTENNASAPPCGGWRAHR